MESQSLFAELAGDFTLLTANSRLARVLGIQYGQWRVAQADAQWKSPDILSWDAWLGRLWELAGLLGIEGIDKRTSAAERRQICRPSGAFQFLLSEYPGLTPRAMHMSPLRGLSWPVLAASLRRNWIGVGVMSPTARSWWARPRPGSGGGRRCGRSRSRRRLPAGLVVRGVRR